MGDASPPVIEILRDAGKSIYFCLKFDREKTRLDRAEPHKRDKRNVTRAMRENSLGSSMMSVVPFPKTSGGKQTPSRSRDKARAPGQAAIDAPYKRKLIAFDAETWHGLQLLARDTMKDIQELADEAFADVLRKHHRPTELKEALRQSAREQPENRGDEPPRDIKPLPPAKAPVSSRRQRKRHDIA
jgi:hypothetical protein